MSAAASPRGTRLRTASRPRGLPLSTAARRIVLGALERLEGGPLELELEDGSVRRFGGGPGPAVRATVADGDLFRRLALRGRTGLGEGYVAGDWHADDLVALLELLVRNAHAAARREPWATLSRLAAAKPHLPRSNGLGRARRHIAYHYDLGNDLFRLFLDDSMTYSCAYFERPDQTLAGAQQAKYRRLCEKLGLGPDDRVLEIGCGWGGFALHAARERGARVTALTISREQRDLAAERVCAAGLDDLVEIRLEDYRRTVGTYTKIVSIEMLEAIGERQFGAFFAACDRLLAPNGLVGLQTIAVPDQRFARYRKGSDWIREYVFPGSLIPSLSALTSAMTRSSSLLVQGLEEIGVHYADTLRAWREQFLANREEAARLGYDERFARTWEFYLASCEALFRTRSLRDLQLVLTRPFNDALPRYPAARVTF